MSYSLSRYIQRRIGKDAPHSIHLLRHQYASFFIEHGGDMFKLQKQLQHSSLKMVKHYAVHYGYTKQELIEDFSPINFSTPKGMKKKLVPAPAPTKKKGKLFHLAFLFARASAKSFLLFSMRLSFCALPLYLVFLLSYPQKVVRYS